ncbi:MAG: S9 family peptidase, partial [Acidobacteriaceae bacterium]
MRRLLALLAVPALAASAQQPFTLQQVLSAPFATSLTAAPSGPLFAWVEDAEGRRNLWIGGPNRPARALTHNTEDDAQDIADLAWSPDASTIAYVYGAEIGNSGRPANPAHLQRPTPVEIYLQPTAGGDPVRLGEGHSPLFTRDGNSVLFIRAGQIFIACFK